MSIAPQPPNVQNLEPLPLGDSWRFDSLDDTFPDNGLTVETRRSHPVATSVLGAGCIMLRHGKRCFTIWLNDEADFVVAEKIIKKTCYAALLW
jgi:hypothetical protein